MKSLNHCIICGKKKRLLFHHSDDKYIFMICNECLTKEDAISGKAEVIE